MTPIRLTVVMTHPVQYFAPWARHITATCPELDLTVVYAIEPTPEQQGTGFGHAFAWDVPLREGYRSVITRAARSTDSVSAKDFFGLDVPEIGDTLAKTRPDLLLVPGWNSRVLVRAIQWANRHRVPLLYRGDSHLTSSRPGTARRLSHLRARWLLRRFDAGLAVGQRAHEYLVSMGMAREAIYHSPHCVDNGFFARAAAPCRHEPWRGEARQALGLGADTFVAAYVGKLESIKRPVDAVRAIASAGFPAALVIAGAGPEQPACEAEAHRTGAQVRFLGFTNQSDLGRVYGVADAVVVPGVETWGLVANEALASGVPIVVSDRVGCAPDLAIAEETGATFRCGDIADFQAALQRVHEFSPASTGEVCQRHVAQFSFEAATAGLRVACQRTLAAVGRAPAPRVLVAAEHMVVPGGLERMNAEIVTVVRAAGSPAHWLLNDFDSAQIAAMAERHDSSWSYGRYRVGPSRHSRNPIYWVKLGWDVAVSNVVMLRQATRRRITHVLLPDELAVVRHVPALWWLRARGGRAILHMQVAPTQQRFYSRLFRWLIDPVVDRFVCNSAFTERELHALGAGLGKSRVIANIVPTRPSTADVAAKSIHPNRVVFVGQLIPQKGLHVLFDAIAQVVAAGHPVSLDVVADLERWEAPSYRGYRAQLQARAAQPDLAGRIRFCGAREDVPAILRAAAVHVAPSLPELREAFGIVVLEAKEAGIPSVVFRSGALADLVRHRIDGWVCEEPTAAAIAEALKYYLDDPATRVRHGAAASAHARTYDREHFSRSWREELGLVLDPVASPAASKPRKHRHG